MVTAVSYSFGSVLVTAKTESSLTALSVTATSRKTTFGGSVLKSSTCVLCASVVLHCHSQSITFDRNCIFILLCVMSLCIHFDVVF